MTVSQKDILNNIKEIDSKINSRKEHFNTIIDAIKKKKEGNERANVILTRMLNYTPSDGEPSINKDDVMNRLNKCNQWLREAEFILPSFENARDHEISELLYEKTRMMALLNH